MLFLPRLQSAQIVFDLARIVFCGSLAQENNGQAVAVNVELRISQFGLRLLTALFNGLADPRVIGLSRLDKRQTNEAFAAQTLVGMTFQVAERGVHHFFDFGAVGHHPGTRLVPPGRGQQHCRA